MPVALIRPYLYCDSWKDLETCSQGIHLSNDLVLMDLISAVLK
jgi:hypothetical protein